MNQEKIGKFIKELRKKNNLTQLEFANKYGVTYQAVSKWENGKNLPDMSLIKQMCIDFDIDINELLDGEYKNKKNNNKLIFILLSLIFILSILVIINLINKDDFEFKTLSSSCDNFNISGSIAYNKNKSSIYISNINYCGGNDTEVYKQIECTLYESHNDVNVKISSCGETKENIKLEDYLKDVIIAVDNYNKICKDYEEENLYLEINATDQGNKIITYKIPLTLDKSCKN